LRFVLALVLLGCGCSSGPTRAALPSPLPTMSASPTPAPSPSASPSALPPVNPVAPALQATYGGAFSADQAQAVRGIPGVAAVARVSLGMVTASAPGGIRQLSVAAVDPLEFRPLAPGPTAQAGFVWQGLLAGSVYLAHEEQPVLGVPLGSALSLNGPHGRIEPRLGGLAANGVPNLAGGLISAQQAATLGVPGPTMLLVGISPGVSLDAISGKVSHLFPQATVNPLVSLVEHALVSGSVAARMLGSFTYKANPDGSITEEASWVKASIVTREVPILGQVTCNRLMFAQLTGALKDLAAQGLANLINVPEYRRNPGNCYQARFVDSDPSRGISYHAWGIAIDINREENPEGGANRQDPRLIAAFQRWGFRWGGVFFPPDPMHFELAGLMQQ